MEELQVKIKKVHNDEPFEIPQYAHDGDACCDLKATSYKYDAIWDNHIYGTNVAMEIPDGYVGLCFSRSSVRNTQAYLTNCVGVIDSTYRGEIMATFKTRDLMMGAPYLKPYEIGDRIAQIMIIPYPKIKFVETDKLSSTERGEGGHGSTGR